MVLKEFPILNKNNKIIILATMVVGVLYPFFTDLELPINPKYISIGALLLGMVLFWEFYGSKKYDARESDFSGMQYRQRSQQPQPMQQQYPPQQVFVQPAYQQYPPQQRPAYGPQQYPPRFQHAPSYEDQMFQEANVPPSTAPVVNPLYKPKSHRPPTIYEEENPEEYVELEEQEEGPLPKVSDVVKRKAKLPTRIPPPQDTSKTASKSALKKFGL